MAFVTIPSQADNNGNVTEKLRALITGAGGEAATLQAANSMNDNLGAFSLFGSNADVRVLQSEFDGVLSTVNSVFGTSTLQSADSSIDDLLNGNGDVKVATNHLDICGLAAENAARTTMVLQNEKSLLSCLQRAGGTIATLQEQGATVYQRSATQSVGQSWGNAVATLQAFSQQKFDDWKELTIQLNYYSSLISPATELAFRTVQLNGNYEGISTTIERDVIQQEQTNPMTGEAFKLGRINALKAFRDMHLLKNNANVLMTNVRQDNAGQFVDTSIYTPKAETDLRGRKFNSSYIKVNTGMFNLLALCRAPGEMAENRTYTYMDQIAPNMRIGNLLIKVGADKYLEAYIGDYQAAIFASSTTQSNSQTETLSCHIETFAIDTATKDVAGKEIATLKALADAGVKTLLVDIILDGSLDHNQNNCRVSANATTIVGCYSPKTPGKNLIGETGMKALVEAASLEISGFQPRGNLLDLTFTKWGTQAELQDMQYPYATRPQSIITAYCPVTEADATRQRRMRTMGNLAVAQTDSLAMSFLLDYTERLNKMTNGSGLLPSSIEFEQFDVQSSGSFYVNPWCMIEEFDIQELCNSLTSSDRWNDMSAAVLNILRDRVPRMMLESQYVTALRRKTNNPTAKAKLGVITSKIMAQYLFTTGDDRTLGAEQSDYENKLTVAICDFKEFDETLFMFPITSGSGTFDQFHFGCRVSGINLITETERDMGAQGKFAMLQTIPVEEFYVTMPIIYQMKVNGFRDYIATSAPVKVHMTDVTPEKPTAPTKADASQAQGGTGKKTV